MDLAHGIAEKAEKHPSVIFLDAYNPLYVAGGDTFQSLFIEAAGGTNAAGEIVGKGDFTCISAEQLTALDPEFIVMPYNPFYTADDLQNDSVWKNIKAV